MPSRSPILPVDLVENHFSGFASLAIILKSGATAAQFREHIFGWDQLRRACVDLSETAPDLILPGALLNSTLEADSLARGIAHVKEANTLFRPHTARMRR